MNDSDPESDRRALDKFNRCQLLPPTHGEQKKNISPGPFIEEMIESTVSFLVKSCSSVMSVNRIFLSPAIIGDDNKFPSSAQQWISVAIAYFSVDLLVQSSVVVACSLEVES